MWQCHKAECIEYIGKSWVTIYTCNGALYNELSFIIIEELFKSNAMDRKLVVNCYIKLLSERLKK